MTEQRRKPQAHQMSFMLPIDASSRVKRSSEPVAEVNREQVDVEAARKLLIQQLERSGLAKRGK